MDEQKYLENISKLLLAILMILAEFREKSGGNKKGRKIEKLLAEAGFNGREISTIINKNLSAVQKAIQRGHE